LECQITGQVRVRIRFRHPAEDRKIRPCAGVVSTQTHDAKRESTSRCKPSSEWGKDALCAGHPILLLFLSEPVLCQVESSEAVRLLRHNICYVIQKCQKKPKLGVPLYYRQWSVVAVKTHRGMQPIGRSVKSGYQGQRRT